MAANEAPVCHGGRPGWPTPVPGGVGAITAVCLALNPARFEEFTFVWLAPLALALYLLAVRALRCGDAPAGPGAA